MKILHLDCEDLQRPDGGGQALRTFEINRRLIQKGHQITVVTMNYPGAIPQTKQGIYYERVGLQKFPFNFISYLLAIPSVIREHEFDLLIEDNIPPVTFGRSPMYTKKPVIAQMQYFQAKFASQKYKIPFYLAEEHWIKFYKNFITLTKSAAQEVRTRCPQARIQTIPNGLNAIPPREHQEKNYLLYLGRLDFRTKGLDFLMNSLAIVQKKFPNISLVIAGRGDGEGEIRKLMIQNKIKNVVFLGHVQGTAKEKILSECLMLLQPSRMEVFPFTFLEAASYGKPVVCFNIKNLRETIEEGKIGLMAPAFDEEKYAKLVIQLIEDKKTRHELGANAYHWAKQHLWDNIAQDQERFYLESLHG